eukprot:555973_1
MSTLDEDDSKQVRKMEGMDDALAQYYKLMGVENYQDEKHIGLCLKYIKDIYLYDSDFMAISKQLCDKCEFPIPPYADIPKHEEKTFIFHILKHCYQYSEPPSNKYIDVIISGCNGTISIRKKLDYFLGSYFKICGRNDYYNGNNNGKLMLFLNDNGLDTDALVDELEDQVESNKQKLHKFELSEDYTYYPNKILEILKLFYTRTHLPTPITLNTAFENSSGHKCVLKWLYIANAMNHELYSQISLKFMEMTQDVTKYKTLHQMINALQQQSKIDDNEVKYIQQLIHRTLQFFYFQSNICSENNAEQEVEDECKQHFPVTEAISTIFKNDIISDNERPRVVKVECKTNRPVIMNELNLDILYDIYNVFNCFLFMNFKFQQYKTADFMVDIKKK